MLCYAVHQCAMFLACMHVQSKKRIQSSSRHIKKHLLHHRVALQVSVPLKLHTRTSEFIMQDGRTR